MNRRDRRRTFIRDLANDVIGHPRFPAIVRQVVLQVVLEQENLKRISIGRNFCDCCRDAGIVPYLTEDGGLMFLNAAGLTAELRAVLVMNRQEIIDHLKMVIELDWHRHKREKQREQPKTTDATTGPGHAPGDPGHSERQGTENRGPTGNGKPRTDQETAPPHRPGPTAGKQA